MRGAGDGASRLRYPDDVEWVTVRSAGSAVFVAGFEAKADSEAERPHHEPRRGERERLAGAAP